MEQEKPEELSTNIQLEKYKINLKRKSDESEDLRSRND
jgi:hypothetical protein